MKAFKGIKVGTMNKLFLQSRNRIIFWFSILAFASIILFITLGYYSAFNIISYLPKITSGASDSFPSGVNQIELKSPWYVLLVDQEGRIAVKTLKGEVIMSGLTYYAEFEGENDNWGLKNVFVKHTNDSTIEIKGNGPRNVLVNLLLIIHNYIPKVDVHIKTHYSINTIVRREALVAAFDVPVSEVYLKNRKIDKENFETEYWLQREGARFGSNERSAMVYHTPSVSSLQLETAKKLLFVNLEYFLDHPHINVPYQEDGGGKWVDLSKANYSKGTERNNFFSINIGRFPNVTPRLMLVPDGYQAGYVFTEHADGGNIQRQQAIYFGSEDISNATDAIGGFVGHKIPTTKSIFYTGPGGSPGSAILENQKNSPLLNFLDQIYATGMYDICMHTPENLNSNREVMEESIRFMKDRYNTVSWIDHGFYGGKINREALVADGLDSNSKYYAADLWEKYDTRYFWSPAVELIRGASSVSVTGKIKEFKFYDAYINFWRHYLSSRDLKELSFYQAVKVLLKRYSYRFELNSLKSNMDNAYPTPLYWQHPTRTKQFYSWTTDYVKGYDELSNKVVEREEIQLNKLVNDRGVFINHGYYVRNRVSDYVISEHNGKLVINPYFDRILVLMARMRDRGDLYITTIRDLLDYWIMLENISFEYLPGGEINVINNNNKPIKGLAIVLKANNVLIDGNVPSMKHVGDDTILWFDIAANKKVKMLVSQ